MAECFDYIAIGPEGVYALCEDRHPRSLATTFIRKALAQGARIERVPVAEAVARHRAFLDTLPEFAGLFAGEAAHG